MTKTAQHTPSMLASTTLVLALLAGTAVSAHAQSIPIERFEPPWTDASTAASPTVTVYQSAFAASTADDKWNVRRITRAPGGESLLGRFNNEAVTLNLDALPRHTHLVVAFDLSIIGDWRGGVADNASTFAVSLTNGTDALRTSFATINPALVPKQSYPGQLGDPDLKPVNATTGSFVRDVHRFTRDDGSGQRDAIYRIILEIPHAASVAGITFKASGLPATVDRAGWAIDNVVVIAASAERLAAARVVAGESVQRLSGRTGNAPAVPVTAAPTGPAPATTPATGAAPIESPAATPVATPAPSVQPAPTLVPTTPTPPATTSITPAPTAAPAPTVTPAPAAPAASPAAAPVRRLKSPAEYLAAERRRLGLPEGGIAPTKPATPPAEPTPATAPPTAPMTSPASAPAPATAPPASPPAPSLPPVQPAPTTPAPQPAPGTPPSEPAAVAPFLPFAPTPAPEPTTTTPSTTPLPSTKVPTTTSPALAMLKSLPSVYLSAFNGTPGPEWEPRAGWQAPTGESFLGRLHNQQATLLLEKMPPHEHLVIATELLIIGDWRGNVPASPNLFTISTASGQELLRATFANDEQGDLTLTQSYPAAVGAGSNQPQAGAYRLNNLRIARTTAGTLGDAQYRLLLSVPHTLEAETLIFRAEGLNGTPASTSWGLDNIAVLTSSSEQLDATRLAAGDASLRLAQLGTIAGAAMIAESSGPGFGAPTAFRPNADTYATAFSAGDVSGWSSSRLLKAPSGVTMLGPFHNERATLSVSGLPAHDDLVVAADVLVMGEWQNTAGNASRFTITDDNGVEIFVSSYVQQAGADTGPTTRKNAISTDALGLTQPDGQPLQDSLYRIVFSLPHNKSQSTLSFGATGLTGSVMTSSWGLQRVSLTARPRPNARSGASPDPTSAPAAPARATEQLTPQGGGSMLNGDIYINPFLEHPAGEEWSVRDVAFDEHGNGSLGGLHNGQATLSLSDLPQHTHLVISADVTVTGDWPGNARAPSTFQITLDDGSQVFASTFATPGLGNRTQSFPDTLGNGFYPPGTGAVGGLQGNLAFSGYRLKHAKPADTAAAPATVRRDPGFEPEPVAEAAPEAPPPESVANNVGFTMHQGPAIPATGIMIAPPSPGGSAGAHTYRLSFTVEHSSASVGIKFKASGLPGDAKTAGWSLDNVAVSAYDSGNPNNAFGGGTFAGTPIAAGFAGFDPYGRPGNYNPDIGNPFANLGYPSIAAQPGGGGGGGGRFVPEGEDNTIPSPGAASGVALLALAGLRRGRRR